MTVILALYGIFVAGAAILLVSAQYCLRRKPKR